MNVHSTDAVWITRLSPEQEAAYGGRPGPLAGKRFAIKDNIDLAGVPTTAACPAYARVPEGSAFVVERLLAAGAVPVGKTNLDQFATGLVGLRSPYGVPRNPHDPDYIPGGSSSGSAVAVARGDCDFALGTDTAGSGRVPAALNGLVGLKPTRGLLSTSGVVPACRSLDCVSLFTRTVAEAAELLRVTAVYDPKDPYAREAEPPAGFFPAPKPAGGSLPLGRVQLRVAVPKAGQLEFFGDAETPVLFAAAVARWQELGALLVEVDIEPLLAAARLLYEGPWVAERYLAVKELLTTQPEALHPITRAIIEPAAGRTAAETFQALYRLEDYKRQAATLFASADFLLLPTLPTAYTVAEVEADPVRLNSRLGYYTNFMNLLDCCGLAVPAGRMRGSLPWGVTLVAPAFHDDRLLRFGALFLGERQPVPVLRRTGASVRVAVCGAHLSGLPLNWQLLELGGRLLKTTRTAPAYRLYALPGTVPPKPGLLQVGPGGYAIEVEVWELPQTAYGRFVAAIPAPLGIGTLLLEDGDSCQGFLCEAKALETAKDVSDLGGWRAYVRTL